MSSFDHSSTEFSAVEVVRFSPELAKYFESLNREWIEEEFEIEDADRLVFSDPQKEIVEPGGQIFFVVSDGRVLGTCAVIRHDRQTFELAKMAVTAAARGRGYGDLLIQSVIDFARQAGAKRLMLLSNTRLKPAISLYEKHGFEPVSVTDSGDYHRVDIQMELCLN